MNQPITFEDTQVSNNAKIATSFCRHFTRTVPAVADRDTRRIQRSIRNLHPLDTSLNPFTLQMVKDAIANSSNSVALGPDDICIHHLKHLGPRGLRYLQHLYNLSINSATCPAIWKRAIITPLLKMGKPKDLASSYRPISLLSPLAKVLERLILPRLSDLEL